MENETCFLQSRTAFPKSQVHLGFQGLCPPGRVGGRAGVRLEMAVVWHAPWLLNGSLCSQQGRGCSPLTLSWGSWAMG